jgi:hypothetical protein
VARFKKMKRHVKKKRKFVKEEIRRVDSHMKREMKDKFKKFREGLK